MAVSTEERRIVTVLFADMAGSTALGEELDPAGAAMGPPVADAGPAGWVIVERSELASDRRALDWRGSRAQQERLNP